jgi:SRSO17 transposase
LTVGAVGRTAIADWSGALTTWEQDLAALKARMAFVFGRAEVRVSAGLFLNGLLSGVERKTGWLMAEQAGLERPYRMQSLLGRSFWNADDLRDLVRRYVVETLGDADGVLGVDETGFVKKGEASVGVARQYSGAAGRIENCQIGVFVGYASRFGQAWIDRRLYLPEAWAKDGAATSALSWAGAFLAKLEAELRRSAFANASCKPNETSPTRSAAA